MPTDDFPQDLTLACSRFVRLAARRADVGVSSVSWRVVSTIEQRGPLRLSEIAERERVTRPTATTVAKRLEEEGLVFRTPDPADSRSVLVDITPAGREKLADWRSRMNHGVGPILDELGDDDRRTLAQAAEILARIVETHDSAPPAPDPAPPAT
ncbi:MarR family winged helix-turn-helix transcriptional regulator [Brachybacterium kimchii]|uniref:MarR family transcriptional regulator n=1 Tax=Brachybacterium kimchii TaxID=2942909 RepID=A0ABY4N339_9MICO|nr:MarR family transcriptional regulator [Brachybacterium kimchii]UQN28963.1 MarR family transcriptional regulator [Brachybacterium kimchii]